MEALAKELVELRPDVILASTTPVVAALVRETRTIPIVFVVVSDPVGSGFVASLPRPGGNITGFINIESSLGGKWVELLKQIAPRITRVAAMLTRRRRRRPATTSVRSKPPLHSLAVTPITRTVRNDADIEQAIGDLAQGPPGGLVVLPDTFTAVHRGAIIAHAARSKVPAVLSFRVHGERRRPAVVRHRSHRPVPAGGAVRRSRPQRRQARRPAGASPTKFELVVNLKTAKALGLDTPAQLLVRADAVIE